jgi:hypothetical protein
MDCSIFAQPPVSSAFAKALLNEALAVVECRSMGEGVKEMRIVMETLSPTVLIGASSMLRRSANLRS